MSNSDRFSKVVAQALLLHDELWLDTIRLGTFIRNTLEHPEMFSFKCPKCGNTIDP